MSRVLFLDARDCELREVRKTKRHRSMLTSMRANLKALDARDPVTATLVDLDGASDLDAIRGG